MGRFVTICLDDFTIEDAQKVRRERDLRFGNTYREEDTDARWVGDLGEACFRRWITKVTGRDQVKEPGGDPRGKPDIIVCGRRIGVKTVKRKVGVKKDYTAQITARHAHEPVDDFFFLSYEVPKKRLWLCGGIPRSQFLEKSVRYGAGQQVHASYTIRKGHEIYNIEIAQLTPPVEWIRGILGRHQAALF